MTAFLATRSSTGESTDSQTSQRTSVSQRLAVECTRVRPTGRRMQMVGCTPAHREATQREVAHAVPSGLRPIHVVDDLGPKSVSAPSRRRIVPTPMAHRHQREHSRRGGRHERNERAHPPSSGAVSPVLVGIVSRLSFPAAAPLTLPAHKLSLGSRWLTECGDGGGGHLGRVCDDAECDEQQGEQREAAHGTTAVCGRRGARRPSRRADWSASKDASQRARQQQTTPTTPPGTPPC